MLENKIAENKKWEEPKPFNKYNIPEFPMEVLPEPIAPFVKELAESTQTPLEMGGLLSLGVLATAFQGRYEIQGKPDWTEPLNLYLLTVAPPAERKSAVIQALTNPLRELEAQYKEEDRICVEQNKAQYEMLQRQKTQAIKKGDSGKVTATINQIQEVGRRNYRQLLSDDNTPESLIQLMEEQGGKITICSAEGGIFDAMKGRYDNIMNIDIYLKAHTRDAIRVGRMGRAENYIPSPHLTMMLAAQPQVLQNFIGNPLFAGRGLCGRFLYAVCQSKMGYRNPAAPSVQIETKEAYHAFVHQLFSGDRHGTIVLDERAQHILYDYMTVIEKRLVEEWAHMQDWGGKLAGTTLRIAGLIHAANIENERNPCEVPLSEETLNSAIQISECLGIHAMIAYQGAHINAEVTEAQYLLKRIKALGVNEFSKRALFQACASHFRTTNAMETPLTVLGKMGYIRITKQETGGRPSEIITVNPNIICAKHSKE